MNTMGTGVSKLIWTRGHIPEKLFSWRHFRGVADTFMESQPFRTCKHPKPKKSQVNPELSLENVEMPVGPNRLSFHERNI